MGRSASSLWMVMGFGQALVGFLPLKYFNQCCINEEVLRTALKFNQVNRF